MIPQEVKDFIKKLVKEAIADELKAINERISQIDKRETDLEKDMLIQKEGDNI